MMEVSCQATFDRGKIPYRCNDGFESRRLARLAALDCWRFGAEGVLILDSILSANAGGLEG